VGCEDSQPTKAAATTVAAINLTALNLMFMAWFLSDEMFWAE
jgi:hypothetical protein